MAIKDKELIYLGKISSLSLMAIFHRRYREKAPGKRAIRGSEMWKVSVGSNEHT